MTIYGKNQVFLKEFDGHEFEFTHHGLLDWSFRSLVHPDINGVATSMADAKVKAMSAIAYDPFALKRGDVNG